MCPIPGLEPSSVEYGFLTKCALDRGDSGQKILQSHDVALPAVLPSCPALGK